MHTCPMVTGLVPHVGGPILPPCEPTVLIGFMPAARVSDMLVCVGPPDVIAKGSPTVMTGYMLQARLGDLTVHGGVIVIGCPTVIVGDSGSGGGGGGGGGGGAGGAGGAGGGAPGATAAPGAGAGGAATKGAAAAKAPKAKISKAQTKRERNKYKKLSAADKEKYDKLLKDAKSDDERTLIKKAFASCHSVDECSTFADKIKGKDATWLNDNCRLTGSSTGTGIQQQWSHSCNATTVQAVRGEMDPIYALNEHEQNPNFGSVDDADATKKNPKLAEEQKKMLTSEYTGSASAAHKGKAANRGNSASGSGRWASDLLNDPKEQTGVTYVTKKDPKTSDAMKAINAGVDDGVPVPIVIGNGSGQYTHYVLVTGKTAGPPKGYTIHDPWSGKTVERSVADVKDGKINIAGSNQITAVEDPQLQKKDPSTKPTC